MDVAAVEQVLGPELSSALSRKGYTQLTAVQEAVLDPALRGRDLRISSQTGSGKTLAIGFALREWLVPAPGEERAKAPAPPRALVVAPTRELAHQSREELQWLFAGCGVRVTSIAGGASYRDEHRELARGPAVIVGTPGRLLDHLKRGAIDPSALAAVVLDEADRLLDMGFRDDLDAILGHAPEEHRTHLVSATFPRAVRALADRVQREPAHVEGTRLGAANLDIDHVLHVIDPRETLSAVINLLLSDREAQTLVFARTRAGVAELAQALVRAGLPALAISGELDQAARNRALAAFKGGRESVLVATDVAARGLDVQEVTRVIHVDPPTSADAYTHRAGRTGRAGRKGTSHLLCSLAQVVPVTRLLRAAGIAHRFEAVPSAQALRRAEDDRLFETLTRDGEPEDGTQGEDARSLALARRVLESGRSERVVARLLARLREGSPEPREVRAMDLPARGRERPAARREPGKKGGPAQAPSSAHAPARLPAASRGAARQDGDYVPFRVTWGGRQGADARRVLALACRRGQVRGSDVGAIRIEADHAIVEVAASVAEHFAEHAARPDRRDKRVLIRPLAPPPPRQGGRAPLRRRK
jgi:ATP-dependent RNA helicase DeaD